MALELCRYRMRKKDIEASHHPPRPQAGHRLARREGRYGASVRDHPCSKPRQREHMSCCTQSRCLNPLPFVHSLAYACLYQRSGSRYSRPRPARSQRRGKTYVSFYSARAFRVEVSVDRAHVESSHPSTERRPKSQRGKQPGGASEDD